MENIKGIDYIPKIWKKAKEFLQHIQQGKNATQQMMF